MKLSRMMKSFKILTQEEGERVDVFLSKSLQITRTKAKRLVEEGHVLVSGKRTKPSFIIKKGLEIICEIPEEEGLSFSAEEIPLEILYEDDFFIAVNKPPAMVVHPSVGHKKGTLLNALLHHIGKNDVDNPRVGIVHRLDKDTTGVILLAKDETTQHMLSLLFKKREIIKVYRAVVHGVIEKAEGEIEGSIGRDPKNRKRMKVVENGGRYAKTKFKVLKRFKDFTYLEIYPETGRTHQIRVHLSHIKHPIVGDPLYGRKDRISTRPMLHALSLSFSHPFTGAFIEIRAEIPSDMEEFIERLAL